MKKMMTALLLACMLLVSATALAEGPVLLVELPEDALMIENVEFEDGDFIQTHQLPGGVTVQILRYAAFDMTLEELAEGEWTGYTDARKLAFDEIDGCPAQGLHLTYVQESDAGKQELSVYTVMIQAQGQKLIFQSVFPKAMGAEKIEADMNAWLDTMSVSGMEDAEVG